MADKKFHLVLDLGTTKVKAILYDRDNTIIDRKYLDLHKTFPSPGWVEQNPEELINSAKEVIKSIVQENLSKIESIENIESIGFANQRETTIIWDRTSGKAVYPAIVWEDDRTKEYCESLGDQEYFIKSKTGLSLLPYFSATKIRWILDHISKEVDTHNLCFGTPDSWLLFNLAEGNPHFTDFTNASRTALFNILEMKWEEELLQVFNIPKNILPGVKPTISNFGSLKKEIIGINIPIQAVCGDQEASLFAAGSDVHTTKITYGTGVFIAQIIGPDFQLIDPFFTTLTASRNTTPNYMIEAKLNMGSQDVGPLLFKPDKALELRRVIDAIAMNIDKFIKLLPHQPEQITIDGGITQYKDFCKIQEEISGIKIVLQKDHDGTALGIAKMLGD